MAKVLFVSTPYENLGIESMSAALKRAGHEVFLSIDPCLFLNPYHKNRFMNRVFSFRQILRKNINNIRPDLVCFSVMTDTLQWGLDLAGMIKKDTGRPVIFGGVHPTIAPESVICHDQVDYLCRGEGEETIVELADHLNDGEYCSRIQGLWSKKSGGVIKNPLRPAFPDLDKLPFADKDIYYSKSRIYAGEYFIMTGRGCEYACSFCCNHVLRNIYNGQFVRRRSVENVVEELRESKNKRNFRFVWFMDDNFVKDIAWVRRFSREYRKHINLPFFCYGHPLDINDEVVSLLREAGCWEMAIGVESVDPDTSRVINRINDPTTVAAAIAVLNKHGIVSAAENIIGLPGEDEGTILRLVDFYNTHRPALVMFSWLKIFPATALFDRLSRDNILSQGKQELIASGCDGSLAEEGNFACKKRFTRAVSLLILVPFLPKRLVRFLSKTGSYKIFIFDPNAVLRALRIIRLSMISRLIFGKSTYDAGARISMRIYLFFMTQRMKALLIRRDKP